MFRKVVWSASQHDSAVWKFLEAYIPIPALVTGDWLGTVINDLHFQDDCWAIRYNTCASSPSSHLINSFIMQIFALKV